MELWGWLAGYVVLLALFHLLLYYVYVRRGDDGARSRSVPGNGTPRRPAAREVAHPVPEERVDPAEGVRCPHCHAGNEPDQAFTYCWNCVSPLRH